TQTAQDPGPGRQTRERLKMGQQGGPSNVPRWRPGPRPQGPRPLEGEGAEMTALAGAPVVVGVDGSKSSMQAVALATRLAVARGRPLRIVHAFAWAELRVPLGPDPLGPPEGGLANEAKRIVADAVLEAEKAAPGLAISGEVGDGPPVPVLLDEARRAALVVLGSRGLGGFTGLLLGSVAVQLAAHAPCPVVVARGDIDRERDILVGVSGSPADE